MAAGREEAAVNNHYIAGGDKGESGEEKIPCLPESSLERLNEELEVPRIGKCRALWVEPGVFGVQRLNFSSGLHRHF
ncbi:hypothetical protein PAMP_017774 [Pampus punctatissimus]